MAEEFGLHELAVEDARKGHQRPKIEEYGDSLFAVLQPVEMVKRRRRRRGAQIGEVDMFVGPNYVLSVRHRTQVGFAAVRARDRARAGTAAPRRRIRLLRADGQRRRPLFPGPRRPRDASSRTVEEQIFVKRNARGQHRSAVRPEAPADGAQACGRSADGGRRQALRRPRAADLRRHGRVFPRRVRPPARGSTRRSRASATCSTTAIQVNLGMIAHRRQRGDQAARRLGRAHHGADADRRHLRHELQATCRSSTGRWATRSRSARWSIDRRACCSGGFRRASSGSERLQCGCPRPTDRNHALVPRRATGRPRRLQRRCGRCA